MNMQPDPIEAIQAAVVTAINTLGLTLVGSGFTPITSSPIPDDEVAQILAATLATCPRCSHDAHTADCPCGCERP